MVRTKDYLGLNDKYLHEAATLLAEGDYVQASEKFWGAAAEIIKAVAAERDIELRSHGEIHRFVTRLAKELNEPQLLRLFGLAAALHQNFYENWLTAEMVVEYGESVRELIGKLKSAARFYKS